MFETLKKFWENISYCEAFCSDCDFDTDSVWKAIGHMFRHPGHAVKDKW